MALLDTMVQVRVSLVGIVNSFSCSFGVCCV